jgi:thymidylate kinase
VLDLPAEEGARRQRAAGKGRDRMERAGDDFHARVAAGYRELAGNARVRALDALGTPDAVQRRVRGALQQAFPGTFALSED